MEKRPPLARTKRQRIDDPAAILAARKRDGVCLYGLIAQNGCSSGLDVHHILTRGTGGDDVLPNLICLCRRHHQEAQAYLIKPRELQETLTRFYGYTYPDENVRASTEAK